jgi:hypothetical protein
MFDAVSDELGELERRELPGSTLHELDPPRVHLSCIFNPMPSERAQNVETDSSNM